MLASNLRVKVIEISHKGPQTVELTAQNLDEHNLEHDKVKIILEGVWASSPLKDNTILHVLNPKYDNDTHIFTIDNSTGLLVIEPDNLITCTLVASTLFCERKTWLNNVFAGQVGTNRAMLVGTLVHEVFQYGVKNKIVDETKLVKYLDEELLDNATVMLEIYSVEQHLNDIRAEAIGYISSVREWIEKFMLTGPTYPLTNDANLEVKINVVSDIEENVWSTKYGLKGKIDVTGNVRVYDRRNKSTADKILPLELKTGNPNLSSSHAAQVSLYSMMIEDRYAETNQGLVIYLKEKAAMHNVTLIHNIKRDLVQRRNQINYFLRSYYYGPEMLNQTRMCKNCERLSECILMSEMYSPGEVDKYSTMKTLQAEATGHLDDKFKVFFKKYHEHLVQLMSKTEVLEVDGDPKIKSSGSFWNYSSKEAEERGTGFGKLQASFFANKSGFITFRRHPDHSANFIADSLKNDNGTSGQPAKKMRIEDYFKPKTDAAKKPDKLKPFDTKLNFTRCRIAISLDNDEASMDSQNSSTAISIGFMSELKEDHFVLKIYEGSSDIFKSELMYRIDKIEKRSNLDIERVVLVRLLAREDWRCDRVRQLVLDPEYKPAQNAKLNLFLLSAGFEELDELESRQQDFVVGAVATDNYYIFDETLARNKVNRTIAVLAKVVCNLERTLLIVAQNIDYLVDLMRILQKKVRFILIDDGKSTVARFQFASNLVKVPQGDSISLVKKYEAYIRQHELVPVVITTYAMSAGGLLFTRRTFDYCVAYDCDSTELLMSLSPMFCSDRHIIIDVKEPDNMTKQKVTGDQVSLSDHLKSLRKTS